MATIQPLGNPYGGNQQQPSSSYKTKGIVPILSAPASYPKPKSTEPVPQLEVKQPGLIDKIKSKISNIFKGPEIISPLAEPNKRLGDYAPQDNIFDQIGSFVSTKLSKSISPGTKATLKSMGENIGAGVERVKTAAKKGGLQQYNVFAQPEVTGYFKETAKTGVNTIESALKTIKGAGKMTAPYMIYRAATNNPITPKEYVETIKSAGSTILNAMGFAWRMTPAAPLFGAVSGEWKGVRQFYEGKIEAGEIINMARRGINEQPGLGSVFTDNINLAQNIDKVFLATMILAPFASKKFNSLNLKAEEINQASKTLGTKPTSTVKEISEVLRKEMKKIPDAFTDNPLDGSMARLKELNDAFNILKKAGAIDKQYAAAFDFIQTRLGNVGTEIPVKPPTPKELPSEIGVEKPKSISTQETRPPVESGKTQKNISSNENVKIDEIIKTPSQLSTQPQVKPQATGGVPLAQEAGKIPKELEPLAKYIQSNPKQALEIHSSFTKGGNKTPSGISTEPYRNLIRGLNKNWTEYGFKDFQDFYNKVLSTQPQVKPQATGGVVTPQEAVAKGISKEEWIKGQGTPKTVKVWNKSKFSNDGAYADIPVIRRVDNVTLYQGGSADGRQFWTPDKKYAESFGKVTEKTGTFYKVDNGNRVVDVYVEAPTPSQLSSLYDKAVKATPKTGALSAQEAVAKGISKEGMKYKSAEDVYDALGFTEGAKETLIPIKSNGKVVGGIDASVKRGYPDTLLIHYVRILPEAQGKGIGTEAITKLFKDNPKIKILQGHATAESKSFWQKQGATFSGSENNIFTIKRSQLSSLYDEAVKATPKTGTLSAQEAVAKGISKEEWIKGQGTPVYHGTNAKFDKFDTSKIGEATGRGDWGDGFYFSDSKDVARSFAKDAGGDIVMEVRLGNLKFADGNKLEKLPEVQKILDDDMGFTDMGNYIKSKGFDGVKYKHSAGGGTEYVVYDPKNIKTPSQLSSLYDEAAKQVKPQATGELDITKQAVPKAVKEVAVPRTQLPIGQGKEKVSSLEARMAGAVKGMTEDQKKALGTTTYNEMNNEATLKKAAEIVTGNPQDAIKMLTGEKPMVEGQNFGSIYTALVNSNLPHDLATKVSTLNFTAMGQNIEILKEINKDSPVKIISDIYKIKEAEFSKRYGGKKPKQVIETKAKEAKAKIKVADKYDWNTFIKSIAC